MSKVVAPISIASIILAACDVDPDANVVEKLRVSLPYGKLDINGEISTFAIPRLIPLKNNHHTCTRIQENEQ
jgi:hypothetical protein